MRYLLDTGILLRLVNPTTRHTWSCAARFGS